MVKSTTTTTEPFLVEKPYPKLVKSNKNSGLIVLKVTPAKGTVVSTGHTSWIVGDQHGAWDEGFTDYLGTVTLEND